MSPKIIFGTASMGNFDIKTGKEFLDVLQKHGVKELDSAFIYEGSHQALGKLEAHKDFIIDSKSNGFVEGCLAKEEIFEAMEQTLKELGVDSINTYFFHSPDPATPLEESLAAMNDLHKAGKFKQFGISNFSPSQVQEIHTICTKNSYILPTVFQGNYNPAARHLEKDLFPVLRSLNISFYAYSPLAGGFLTKNKEVLAGGTDDLKGGRWEKGDGFNLYDSMYNKKPLVDALAKWEEISKESGISKAALAYRWVAYSSQLSASKGDAILIGASRTSQLEQTLESIKAGPLDAKTAAKIDAWFDLVKDEAPVDNYQGWTKK